MAKVDLLLSEVGAKVGFCFFSGRHVTLSLEKSSEKWWSKFLTSDQVKKSCSRFLKLNASQAVPFYIKSNLFEFLFF